MKNERKKLKRKKTPSKTEKSGAIKGRGICENVVKNTVFNSLRRGSRGRAATTDWEYQWHDFWESGIRNNTATKFSSSMSSPE